MEADDDDDGAFPLVFHFEESEADANSQKRKICRRCQRPNPATCFCPALPEQPIKLGRCHCLVLQHPHELRRKNRSLPIIELSMHHSSLTVVVGRRFGVESGNAVKDLMKSFLPRSESGIKNHTWLVFPGPQAVSLSTALNQLKHRSECEDEGVVHFVTLIFLDATWQFACEMDRNLEERHQYPEGMLRVSIGLDDLPQDVEFKPRRFEIRRAREDDQFCTAEAISRVIAATEGKRWIHEQLMRPLDLMVEQWTSFQPEKSKAK